MRKLGMALAVVVALSVGMAWAESRNAGSGKAGSSCPVCCCAGKTCPK